VVLTQAGEPLTDVRAWILLELSAVRAHPNCNSDFAGAITIVIIIITGRIAFSLT
jgi:hypothetical protein